MILYVTGLISTSSGCIPKNSDLQCDPIIRKYGESKQGLTRYILTVEELKKNDYPMKGQFFEVFAWLGWVGFCLLLILPVNDMPGHVRYMTSVGRGRSVSCSQVSFHFRLPWM